MRILIDIGHPGHVHYFRNFYKIMKSKGHDFLFISRDKEVTFALLEYFQIPYKSRGKGKKGIIGKLIYILFADFIIYKHARQFKPDIFLSFASPYMGHVAFVFRKPNIIVDDTEHATLEHLMYKPFASVILTPNCFYKKLGDVQIKFNGYMELCYLHPNYFKPNPSVLNLLGVAKGEKYVIMRFVSWNASHDMMGQNKGLALEEKIELVKIVNKYAKIFITSEIELPEKLKKFNLHIPPERMHDAIAYAKMFIGESLTMASEASILGTPSLCVSTIEAGTLSEQNERGLVVSFKNSNGLFRKVEKMLIDSELNKKWKEKKDKLLIDKIDVTAFMIWFVENYPKSIKIMKNNSGYQLRFK